MDGETSRSIWVRWQATQAYQDMSARASAWAKQGRAYARQLRVSQARWAEQSRDYAQRLARSAVAWTIAVALAADLVLLWALGSALLRWVIDLGFDQDRAWLLAGLIVPLPAALLGALLWRRRAAAIGGTLAGFALSIVLPFARHAALPAHDILGAPLALDVPALLRVLVMLLGLAALGAALGAGLGAELADWLRPAWAEVRPLAVDVVRQLLRRQAGDTLWPITLVRPRSRPLIQAGIVLAVVALQFWLVGEANTLFFYGPDAALHPVPPISVPTAGPATPAQVIAGSVTTVTYTSPIFGGARRSFEVYVPLNYTASSAQQQRYPVVYLLHGSPGHPNGMFSVLLPAGILDRLIETHQIGPVIAVAPDGNSSAPFPSEWLNSADGRERVEDAFLHEVIPYVDAHYRTMATPAGRVIAGLSMGGFGATNLAVKHPDIFGGVIALGAYFVPEGGAVRGHPALIAANSPGLVLPSHPDATEVRFFLAAGTDDKPYYSYTLAFAQELAALGATYTLQVSPGGHSWELWSEQSVAGLRWFFGSTDASSHGPD
jgi:enterochelin esterase-like enzyme